MNNEATDEEDGGEGTPNACMAKFDQIKAMAQEHFDECLIVVRGTAIIEGKPKTIMRWHYSDDVWADGAMQRVQRHILNSDE